MDGEVTECLENRRLSARDGEQSPLVRIAVALEGILAECRKMADLPQPGANGGIPSAGKQPAPSHALAPQLQEQLTQDVSLAAQDRPQGKLPSESPYLDANGAAEYLGISVSSLYGIVERGHLKPLRGPRRTYRFRKEMLDDYLRRGKKAKG